MLIFLFLFHLHHQRAEEIPTDARSSAMTLRCSNRHNHNEISIGAAWDIFLTLNKVNLEVEVRISMGDL